MQPIFTAGRLEGELDFTKARRVELAANYRQTVLTAFKETIDALSAVNTSEARHGLLRSAAESAAEAYRLADLNYRSGAADFLTVLDAQRTLLASQDSVVQSELDRYSRRRQPVQGAGRRLAAAASCFRREPLNRYRHARACRDRPSHFFCNGLKRLNTC